MQRNVVPRRHAQEERHPSDERAVFAKLYVAITLQNEKRYDEAVALLKAAREEYRARRECWSAMMQLVRQALPPEVMASARFEPLLDVPGTYDRMADKLQRDPPDVIYMALDADRVGADVNSFAARANTRRESDTVSSREGNAGSTEPTRTRQGRDEKPFPANSLQ